MLLSHKDMYGKNNYQPVVNSLLAQLSTVLDRKDTANYWDEGLATEIRQGKLFWTLMEKAGIPRPVTVSGESQVELRGGGR